MGRGNVPLQAEQSIHLPADPASAALARTFVRDYTRRSSHRGLEEVAVLCVTELVANVSVHTDSAECVVTVKDEPGDLTIEVADDTVDLPALEAVSPYAEHGRGLQIVAALAGEWGVRRPSEQSKAVWLRLCDPQ